MRSIGFALALIAGCATAGEPMDCYNDEADPDLRYTRTEPDILRVTDADISKMLTRIRENESRTGVNAKRDSALRASISKDTSNSD
jgi:hypothetical protein